MTTNPGKPGEFIRMARCILPRFVRSFRARLPRPDNPAEPKASTRAITIFSRLWNSATARTGSTGTRTPTTRSSIGDRMRLFDYTLEMHSNDHRGLLFDNLSFSNFGYGGDPNDVTRLHIDKNKWYDFQLLFRRDKNFWDYNLFANPLNPASSKPAIAFSEFAQRDGSGAAHAGLQSDDSAAVAAALPPGVFAQCG